MKKSTNEISEKQSQRHRHFHESGTNLIVPLCLIVKEKETFSPSRTQHTVGRNGKTTNTKEGLDSKLYKWAGRKRERKRERAINNKAAGENSETN